MNDIIIAGIVLYNPDLKLLQQELLCLQKNNLSVVIVDNNSLNKKDIDNVLAKFPNIKRLIYNKENLGIAKAHNQILQTCDEFHYNWAITLDQDSEIPENMVVEYIKNIASDIGVICPHIEYIGGCIKHNKTSIKSYLEEKEWEIASGSMVNVNAWKSIGGFDEKMFIDLVDRDFCYRIRKKSFRIVAINNVILKQNLGKPLTKRILGINFNVTNHNAFRKYYKVRNYIYLLKKKEVGVLDTFGHILQLIFEIIIIESNKREKLKSVFKAISDGYKL